MENKNIDTKAVARLSRLSFTDAEHLRLAEGLDEFIGFAQMLDTYAPQDLDLSAESTLASCHAREDGVTVGERIADGLISVPLTVEVDK